MGQAPDRRGFPATCDHGPAIRWNACQQLLGALDGDQTIGVSRLLSFALGPPRYQRRGEEPQAESFRLTVVRDELPQCARRGPFELWPSDASAVRPAERNRQALRPYQKEWQHRSASFLPTHSMGFPLGLACPGSALRAAILMRHARHRTSSWRRDDAAMSRRSAQQCFPLTASGAGCHISAV